MNENDSLAAMRHQQELEEQEQLEQKHFEEFRRLENQLFGQMLGAIDCLKIAEKLNFEALRIKAIDGLIENYDQHKKLKDELWRKFK